MPSWIRSGELPHRVAPSLLLEAAYPPDPARNHTRPEHAATVADDLMLFISHASADASIAEAIVRLFEKALKISARRIRCTSVGGYKLPAGARADAALRAEVLEAKLFVAILTPASLASQYVLFELGARWGADKSLFPVLASGMTARDLRPPLGGLNALDAAIADQVRQLLEDAAEALGERLEPAGSYSGEIESVVSKAKPG